MTVSIIIKREKGEQTKDEGVALCLAVRLEVPIVPVGKEYTNNVGSNRSTLALTSVRKDCHGAHDDDDLGAPRTNLQTGCPGEQLLFHCQHRVE